VCLEVLGLGVRVQTADFRPLSRKKGGDKIWG
jgi:hypothetical protein